MQKQKASKTWDHPLAFRRISALCLCVSLAIFLCNASELYAFIDYIEGSSNIRGRMAVDLMSGFSRYPKPEIIYPKDSEGFNSTTSRLLIDSSISDMLRLDFNGYIYASSNNSFFFEDGITDKDSPYRFPKLYWNISESDEMLLCGEVDQMSAKYFTNQANFTIGRQPISLANNFIFTPNDFFYPFAASAVDREFRPGVDALRYDLDFAELSTISAIGVAGYEGNDASWDASAAILRAGANIKGIDVSVLAGKTSNRRLLGFALNAEALKLGMRVEGNYSHPTKGEAHADFFQISAGIDRRWDNSLHIMMEYYYHGNGKSKPEDYLEYARNNPDEMDMYTGRNYFGLFVQGDATPLLKLQGAVLANLDDGSLLFGPGLTYSISDEAELLVGGTIPYGKASEFIIMKQYLDVKSEFGLYPRTVYMLGRIYF